MSTARWSKASGSTAAATAMHRSLGRPQAVDIENTVRHVRMAGLANFLLGAFLVRWPAALPIPLQDRLLQRSFLIVGGLIAVCSAARVLFPQRHVLLSVANLLFGFWILLSPLIFRAEMTWQLVVELVAAGLALMAFARWSISESGAARDPIR
jgi:hypothetical protein